MGRKEISRKIKRGKIMKTYLIKQHLIGEPILKNFYTVGKTTSFVDAYSRYKRETRKGIRTFIVSKNI